MSESNSSKCPVCGAPRDPNSREACPHCLMLAAVQPTEGSLEGVSSPPPTLAEVAAAFPQLEIIELIGQGGMGCVFKARQPRLNRLVALKLLPASLAERDPAFAGRFEREGQLLARLHHPNIVAVHDSGTAGEFFYLIMEYVDGVNLRQAMRTRQFTAPQALAIVPHICDALQFAHDEGVLHRDIKPENILLDSKGRVKLADFGIAKLVAEADLASTKTAPSARTELTHSGAALGTPSYMAPEQRETPNDIDHRADIYSLGVVFYELLTGELPRDRFSPPSSRSAADPRVDPIVRQALEKDRARRQGSAGEVRTQLTSLGLSASASAPGSSKSRLAVALLLLVLAIIAPLMVMRSLDVSVQQRSAEHLAEIKLQQRHVTHLSTQLADAQASAGRAASRAGDGALPEPFRKQAREEQEHFEAQAGKARVELALANAKLGDLMSKRLHENWRSWMWILLSMVPLATGGLVLLARNGNGRIASLAGGTLLVLILAYIGLRHARGEPDAIGAQQPAKLSVPQYASITSNEMSVYFAHADGQLHYAVSYPGNFTTSTSGSHNRHGITWRDESAIKLENGRSFGLTRDSVNELFLTINGSEFDLRKGRVFTLADDGTVTQRNVHPSLEEVRAMGSVMQAIEASRKTPSHLPEVLSTSTVPKVESWSYTPRHLTRDSLIESIKAPSAVKDCWSHEVSVTSQNGTLTVTGPREYVRRAATMLRVLDHPQTGNLADLPLLNMDPEFFTKWNLPLLMVRTDFTKAPITEAFREKLQQAGVSATQLGKALSAHVLELEKATFVNQGVPFEQIVRSPGASTHYEATIPCADRPGQPLTFRIQRTTQQIGTQSKIDEFAPWLIEEAKSIPSEGR